MSIFKDAISEIIGEINRKTSCKSQEYARGNDEFYNFKQGSALCKMMPEVYLYALRAKHEISIATLVNDVAKGNKIPSQAVWLEKITDNMLYLCILYSMVEKRYQGIDNNDERYQLSLADLQDTITLLLTKLEVQYFNTYGADLYCSDIKGTYDRRRRSSETWLSEHVYRIKEDFNTSINRQGMLAEWQKGIIDNMKLLSYIYAGVKMYLNNSNSVNFNNIVADASKGKISK